MIIKRIQVEEGFLDGLDVTFARGLNVVIGPRGTGKTSVIELIRFCLGAPTLTDQVTAPSRQHALSILGSGSVTVTVDDGSDEFSVTRTADHWTMDTSSHFAPPVMLSQSEIETVGRHASGRLRLIDSIGPASKTAKSEEKYLAQIRSQTQERRTLSQELLALRSQFAELSDQLKEAETLKKSHGEALKSIANAKVETDRLTVLTSKLASIGVRSKVYGRVLTSLQQRENRIQDAATEFHEVERWPEAAGDDDPLLEIRESVALSNQHLQKAKNEIKRAIVSVQALAKGNQDQAVKFEEEARNIRRKLETLKAGAGEIARKLAVLVEKSGQKSALKALIDEKNIKLRQIQEKRQVCLNELESARVKRYEERSKIVSKVNSELGPRIKVIIERGGVNTDYVNAITSALRGSGLRINEAAPIIAREMSPSEFVIAVENGDAEQISDITDLPLVRCAKIVERLNEQGVENILTAAVDDSVTFYLLDGTDYKTSEELSMGQRCTIVLPLLLKQHDLALIVDQPEDHLDNAFIVDTLIKAILQRKADGQLIFSTHNANIPVIGEADRVIVMGSDGSRGFVQHAASLDDEVTVNAITNVMEGGMEAFDKRSTFYHNSTDEAD